MTRADATASGRQESERRIQQVLRRARRETGARDLIVFGGARLWLALVSLTGFLFVSLSPKHSPRVRREET